MSTKDKIGWFLIAYGLFSFFQGGGGLPGVVPGPRQVVILYESEQVTPALSQEFVLLRTGANAEYMKAKGHPAPLILDDDTKGPDGQPVELVTRLLAENVSEPAVFVLAGKDVVAKQPLTKDDGAASEVMGILKGAGG